MKDIYVDYKDIARRMLKLNFPMLMAPEIEEAINWSIEKRETNHAIRVNNNYKKSEA